MKKTLFSLLLAMAFGAAYANDYTKFVNPFIGTQTDDTGALSGSTCMLVLDDKPLKMEKTGNGTMKLKRASELNENFQAILTKLKEAGNKNVSLIQEYNALAQKGNLTDAAIARIKKQREQIKDEIKTIMQESMVVNRNNIIPVLLLQQGIEDMGIDFAEKFLKIYAYKDRPSLKSVHERIKSEKAKASGKMIDFTMPDITGKERKLSDFVGKGKYILVDFWATWCGPCRAIAPIVEELANEYEGKVVVAKCDVEECDDIAAEFSIRNIPTLIFIKDGAVKDKLVGAVSKAKVEEKIQSLL